MIGRLRRARRFLEQVESSHTAVPRRAAPSLARDALVLALDPGSGKVWNQARFTVPAALLVELVVEGRLEVSGSGRKARVSLRDPSPLGDRELDDALVTIGTGVFGQRVTTLVGVVPQSRELLRRLVADGVITEEARRVLGLVTVRRYRPTPAAGRDALVTRVRGALLGESVPDERTALLVSVLVDVHPKVFVPRERLREARRRSAEIRERACDDVRAVLSAVLEAATRSD